MQVGEEKVAQTLRQLRSEGKLSQPLDDSTARELLKTPPSSLSLNRSALDIPRQSTLDPMAISQVGRHHRGSAAPSPGSGGGEGGTAQLVRQLCEDCDAFNTALVDNTRLAKEQMQRSLLQLFEDTAREKLPEALQRAGKGTAKTGSNASLRTVSKRPTDRGLDRKDLPSEVIIPDALRIQLSGEIQRVVEHEMSRCFGVVSTDIQRILNQVDQIKGRSEKLEEEVLQLKVESRVQAEELGTAGENAKHLQRTIDTLTQHTHDKDLQMDLLRDQVSRRSNSLDETRVKFRKEVMRYKQRIMELEHEVDTVTGRRRDAVQRRASFTETNEQEEISGEMLAVAENAVKEAKEQSQEEIKHLRAQAAKEKKALMGEMTFKISQRDNEISQLKQRIATITGTSVPSSMTPQPGAPR